MALYCSSPIALRTQARTSGDISSIAVYMGCSVDDRLDVGLGGALNTRADVDSGVFVGVASLTIATGVAVG